MRKVLSFILFSALVLTCIFPASALTFNFPKAEGISNPIIENGVNRFYTAENYSIHKYDVFGYSYSDGVYDIPDRVTDVYVTSSAYYYVTYTGYVYKTSKSSTYQEFDLNPETGNTIMLARAFTTSSYNSNILVDSKGKIFVTDGTDKIYYVDQNKRVSVLYHDTTQTKIRHLFPTNTGKGLAFTTEVDPSKIYTITDTNTDVQTISYSTLGRFNYGYRLTNGYLICSMSDAAKLNIRQVTDDGVLVSNIVNEYSVSELSSCNTQNYEVIVYPDGTILVHAPKADHTIGYFYTYSTYGDIGGFNFEDPSSGDIPSTTTNPLVDYDGDGVFTQEDAKQFSLNIGPIAWILMLFIFLMVALGAKR